MKADWLSLSLGSPVRDEWIAKAVADVLAAGIPVFAAVGNSGPFPDTDDSPGDLDGVITVGALGPDGVVARFSGRGQSLDLLAPGVDIVSTVSNRGMGGYASFSGSSMATPFVSGLVALLLERKPSLDPAAVKKLLLKRSRIPGKVKGAFDRTWGFGVIDAADL